MTASTDPVTAALGALRDAGMVTGRDALNTAWSELTGRSECQVQGEFPRWRDRRLVPRWFLFGDLVLGPCAGCSEQIVRYGTNGRTLCAGCST